MLFTSALQLFISGYCDLKDVLVDACVGLNWLLVSFLSHVNKNIIHSFSKERLLQKIKQ